MPRHLAVGTNQHTSMGECRVKEHCIQRGLAWDDSLASTSCQEQEYYEDLLRFYRYNYRVGTFQQKNMNLSGEQRLHQGREEVLQGCHSCLAATAEHLRRSFPARYCKLPTFPLHVTL